jgi:hypothetical protein
MNPEKYRKYLEEYRATDERKDELLRALWELLSDVLETTTAPNVSQIESDESPPSEEPQADSNCPDLTKSMKPKGIRGRASKRVRSSR